MSKKKILKDSALYIVLGFLPMGINFLLSPLYSHILSPEQNAILSQATIFQSFLQVFLSLSIDSAFSRFYFDYCKDPRQLKAYMSTVILFVIFVSVIAFFILLVSGDRLFGAFQKNTFFTYSKFGYWVFMTTFATVIQSFFISYYRNRQDTRGFSVISLSYFLFPLAGTLSGLLIFKAGALGSIAGRGICSLSVAIVLLAVFFKRAGFHLHKKYLKESLRYSVPLIPYIILMALFGNIDRILVERYFDLASLGIYNFAFLISGAVAVFITVGQNVATPIVYKLWSEETPNYNRLAQTFKWYHFACTAALCIGLAASVVFTKVFIAKAYHAYLGYIGPLFLAYIFRLYYMMYSDSLFFFKKTKWISLITLISFLAGVASNLLLIPALGILGVSISVMVINLIQALGAYVQVRLYRINMSSYKFAFNHVYTVLLIASFFTGFIILKNLGIDVSYANYIPLVIFLTFSFFSVYRSRSVLMDYIQMIRKRPSHKV